MIIDPARQDAHMFPTPLKTPTYKRACALHQFDEKRKLVNAIFTINLCHFFFNKIDKNTKEFYLNNAFYV